MGDFPKLDLFKYCNNNQKIKMPDLGEEIKKAVGSKGDENLIDTILKDSGIKDGISMDVSELMGESDAFDFSDLPDIPSIMSNGIDFSTAVPSTELFSMGNIEGINMDDLDGGDLVDMKDLGTETLNINLNDLEDDTEDAEESGGNEDDLDLRNFDLKKDVMNGLDFKEIDKLDIDTDELGLGFDPRDVFKNASGGGIEGLLTQLAGHASQTFTVENLSSAAMYKVTDNKFGSMGGMVKSFSSLGKKIGGGSSKYKQLEGEDIRDYAKRIGAAKEDDMSYLDNSDYMSADSANMFRNMAFNSTHILGANDEADMSIDAIFSKTTLAFGASMMSGGNTPKDLTGLYKTSGFSDLKLVEDTKLMAEDADDTRKMMREHFGMKDYYGGDIDIVEEMSKHNTAANAQYYNTDLIFKAAVDYKYNSRARGGGGIFGIGGAMTMYENNQHAGSGGRGGAGNTRNLNPIEYEGFKIDGLKDFESSLGEDYAFTNFNFMGHSGGGSHSSEGSFGDIGGSMSSDGSFDTSSWKDSIKSVLNIDNFKSGQSMDVDDLLDTGFDFSGEGLSQDELLSSSGVNMTDISKEADNIVSNTEFKMPDISESGIDLNFDFNLDSPTPPKEPDTNSIFSNLNLEGITSGIGDLGKDIDILNGTTGGATKDDFINLANQNGFDISEEGLKDATTLGNKKQTYDDFIKGLDKMEKEEMEEFYNEF